MGTGWRRGGAAQGIGLLLLLTADQTVATMLTHYDPITSKNNLITSTNKFIVARARKLFKGGNF